MLVIVDNYDSFTFNLVQRIGEVDRALAVRVVRNDAVMVADIERLNPTHLIISPGPGTPRETGICAQVIERFRGRIPILGVCLGHQVIAQAHGVPVSRHARPMHGKTSRIHHDGIGIFRDVPNPFVAARYHSLIVQRDDVPSELEVSAWTDDDEVMGLRWTPGSRAAGESAPASMNGVQFHPESYLTDVGRALLANFLSSDAGQIDSAVPALVTASQ